jgi:hypothetical protein
MRFELSAIVGGMADPIFEHPRLAAIYDALEPDRSDLDVLGMVIPLAMIVGVVSFHGLRAVDSQSADSGSALVQKFLRAIDHCSHSYEAMDHVVVFSELDGDSKLPQPRREIDALVSQGVVPADDDEGRCQPCECGSAQRRRFWVGRVRKP